MFKNAGNKKKFSSPGYENFGLDMCQIWRSMVSRLVPLFMGLKPPLPIGVANGPFYPN